MNEQLTFFTILNMADCSANRNLQWFAISRYLLPYGLMVNFLYEMFRFLKSFLYLCNVFNKSSIIKWAER